MTKFMEKRNGKYFYSEDKGVTWRKINYIEKMRTIIEKRNSVLILKSNDGGNKWFRIEMPQNNGFEASIYPNPAMDAIFVSFESTQSSEAKYFLHNFMGERIRQFGTFENADINIDISSLTTGIYFLGIEVNGINKLYSFYKE